MDQKGAGKMATQKQREAAKKNIGKVRTMWKSMTSRAHARAQPEGGARKRPGAGRGGEYFHVAVRPKTEFVTFRTQDVGEPGHIQRVGGKRSSGSWDTVKWLISKEDAHVAGKHLVPDTPEAKQVLSKLGSEPVHISGDRFKAAPRRNVPERSKPTAAQKRARRTNIRKAQRVRQKAA
jgi:hypothetical protein